jgi:type I restriction enzyme R subunit
VYTENDFNKKIVIEERERKRVQDMLAAINQNEKTIVFCANQAHALMVRNLINQEADSTSVDYCVRVTANDGALGDTYGEPMEPDDTGGDTGKRGKGEGEGEDTGGDGDGGGGEGEQPTTLKIRLSDGKVRELQSMTSTYFYVDGKPISAEEFLQKMFDTLQLPSLFSSEEKLREIWANPLTRRDLMSNLEKEGCDKDDLLKMQELINAEDSDLFDVLQYIAYAKETISRAARVETNKDNIYTLLNAEQREFVSYVLRNYVEVGVDELDVSKLSTVLTAKYGSIHAAQQQLGNVQDIQRTFIEFQSQLYKEAVG